VIENFLRPPRGAGEVLADAVRLLGVLSVAAAAFGWGPLDMAVLALSMIGVVLPRFLGARPALDGAFGIVLLVAAWSSVLDLYTTVAGWDIVVHFLANGLVAAVAYVLLVRIGVLPAAGGSRFPVAAAITLVTAIGLSAGVLWEIVEWAGHTYVDSTIFVAYDDTIGDLVAGGAGAFVAGCSVRFLAAHNRSASSRQRVPVPG
jgi:hypothetical protein